MASSLTGKVFKAGNSYALRLPSSLGITKGAFEIVPSNDGFTVVDKAARARRIKALETLMKLPPIREEWPRP